MQHPATNDEVSELASLFAAGALSPQEEAEFRQHWKDCAVCEKEARSFQETISCLSLALPAVAAPARVRKELLERVQAADFRIVRADEGAWRVLTPGVVAKHLYRESRDGNAAMLLRMEAGAQFPPHWHADVEHCYVLEGDLHFGDLALGPGDYQCAMASTTHIASHSEKGCMVLIVASQQNQILPWTR